MLALINKIHLFTHGLLLFSQRLQNLGMTTLLTPPNSPQIVKQSDVVKTHQDKWGDDDSMTVPWSSGEDLHDEGNSDS